MKEGNDTRSEFLIVDGNNSANPDFSVVQTEKEETETQRRFWAATVPIVYNNKSHK